jgi:ABC-type transporter Mla subunit MlaD
MRENLSVPKFTALTLAAALFLVLSYSALAEDATPTTSVRDRAQSRIEDKRAQLEERRENIQSKLEMRRTEIASKTAQLRLRLQQFKDQTKASLVDRINTVLDQINQRQTQQMKKHLEKMSDILDRVGNRVNQVSSDGQDTASASAAVADAREAIASASAAVDEQMTNDYTIEVSTESAVRADAKEARDALHQDLRDVRSLVIAAKQAVANAIKITATTLKGLKIGQQ